MSATSSERGRPRPYTLIAELTYRCPLRCAYCSNPLDHRAQGPELPTGLWCQVLQQAEALGVLQVHFTGGEPLLRPDLEELVRTARQLDLYTSLITSGIPLDRPRLARLRHAGLDCVQISLVDTRPEKARQITGHAAPLNKIQACQWVKREGLPLTLNVVVHRHNIDHLEDMIALAERLGADRLELANTQYHGWAALNRDALLPGREQLRAAGAVARAARDRLAGTMEVVFVTPDYYSDRPRACMDGWGRRYLHVSPDGTALPCHAARSLRHLQFESVRDHTLEHIWYDSAGFNAYRGEAWMREPCRSCPERSRDFAGCRCQAFALTGDAAAADPACALSPHHHRIAGTRHDTGVQAAPVPLRLRGQRLRPGSPEADRQQVGAPEPATPAGPRAAEADRE